MEMKGRKGKEREYNPKKNLERERDICRGSHKTDIYVPFSPQFPFFFIILHSLVRPLLTKYLKSYFSLGLADLTFLTHRLFPSFFFGFFHIRPSLIESLCFYRVYIFFFSSQWLPKPLCSSLWPLHLRSHLMVLSGSCRLMGRSKYIKSFGYL